MCAFLSSDAASPLPHVTALVAGGGRLPQLLMGALQAKKHAFVVLVYSDTDPSFCQRLADQSVPHLLVSLGQVGKALHFLKEHHVKDIVMAGKFQRPHLKQLKVDVKGGLWLAGLLKEPRGDDALLRFLAKKLEGEGFQIVSPQAVLQDLTLPAGCLTNAVPQAADHTAIATGFKVLRALSPFDVGQALVMLDGVVVGIEGAEGTDALIKRCAVFKKPQQRSVLIKGAKATQDLRLDPPALGATTIALLKQHSFVGVAFEANKTLVLEKETCIQKANAASLFVCAVEGKGGGV